MKSIVLLFPYFGGAFPTQFKIWWASALENHTVDFLIFTDADIKRSEEHTSELQSPQ